MVMAAGYRTTKTTELNHLVGNALTDDAFNLEVQHWSFGLLQGQKGDKKEKQEKQLSVQIKKAK